MWRLATLGSLLGVLLLLAAGAVAQVPGATYKGTTSRGGVVQLEVSADGGTVAHFSVTVGLACGRQFDTFGLGGHPIVDHSFSYHDETDPNLTYGGSFSGQRAQGTLSYRDPFEPSCSADLTWTASVIHTLTVVFRGTGDVHGLSEVSSDNFDCHSKTCSAQLAGSVTLTATTYGQNFFGGWSGDGCSGTGKCVVRMDADTTVTATFKTWTVTITKHPSKQTKLRTATFAFASNAPGSTFKCLFIGSAPGATAAQKPCSSPKTYANLKPGRYDFTVQATNRAGDYGPMASYRFTVLR